MNHMQDDYLTELETRAFMDYVFTFKAVPVKPVNKGWVLFYLESLHEKKNKK